MQKGKLLLTIILLNVTAAFGAAETIWIAGKGGVYRSVLNEETGELSEPMLSCSFDSGSFLAIHPELDVIYATYAGRPDSGYASLVAKGTGGMLEIQSLQLVDPAARTPAHIGINAAGTLLSGSHYSSQSFFLLELEEDGRISNRMRRQMQAGSGPKPQQDKSHPHWGGFSKDGLTYHSVDLGTDEIWTYRLGAKLDDVKELRRIGFPPGSGPRHMAWDEESGFAYVSGELSLEVSALSYDASKGSFRALQRISAVAEGEGSEGSSLSEILLHPSGTFLYTAVRGKNLISAFRVEEETGLLGVIEREKSIVARPRNFCVTPSGKWLIAAGQDSDDLVVFKIDLETGELEPLASKVHVPTPVCVRAWGRM